MRIRHEQGIPSSLKVIRDNCLACTGGSPSGIKNCTVAHCRMWPYRFGRNPKRDDLKVPVYDNEGRLIAQTDYPGYLQNKHRGSK